MVKIEKLTEWYIKAVAKVKYDTPEFWKIVEMYKKKLNKIVKKIEKKYT